MSSSARRTALPLIWSASLALAGCGGSEAASPPEETVASAETSSGAEAPTEAPPEEAPVEEPPPAPPLPALTASDPHTHVVGVLEGSCVIRGIEDDVVYVSSYAGAGRGSVLSRLTVGTDAVPAPVVVHQAPELLEYRVGFGHVAMLENAAGFGTATIRVMPIAGGEPVEVARQIRQSTWLLGPDGVLWGDPSFTEPHVQSVSWAGGEPVTVEELRPVFDEDRLEQMILSEGELVFVAVRTRQNQGGGYFCHELRGGPSGQSRTLRRYRRCPSDEELLTAVSASREHVYYFRDTGFYRVSRAPSRSAPREEPVVRDTQSLPTASATDGRFLVWIDGDGLMRLALGASAIPERIGEPSRVLGAPVIRGDSVYWTRSGEARCVVLSRALDAPALPAP